MKALNAGLLVVGAALAGGIAYRLTDPPPIAVTAPRVQPAFPQAAPSPQVAPAPLPVTRWRAAEPAIASAPPPVYTEPPPPPAPRSKPSPLALPARAPAPARPSAPAPAPVIAKPEPVPYQQPPLPKPDPARHVTLQEGAGVAVRMAAPVSAERMKVGEIFSGALAEPLIADGLVVGERGAPVSGRVISINRDALTLRLLNFQTADGQRVEISTEPVTILSGNILRFRIAAKIIITERKT